MVPTTNIHKKLMTGFFHGWCSLEFQSMFFHLKKSVIFPGLPCRRADVLDLEGPVITLNTSCKSATGFWQAEWPFLTSSVRLMGPTYHMGWGNSMCSEIATHTLQVLMGVSPRRCLSNNMLLKITFDSEVCQTWQWKQQMKEAISLQFCPIQASRGEKSNSNPT